MIGSPSTIAASTQREPGGEVGRQRAAARADGVDQREGQHQQQCGAPQAEAEQAHHRAPARARRRPSPPRPGTARRRRARSSTAPAPVSGPRRSAAWRRSCPRPRSRAEQDQPGADELGRGVHGLEADDQGDADEPVSNPRAWRRPSDSERSSQRPRTAVHSGTVAISTPVVPAGTWRWPEVISVNGPAAAVTASSTDTPGPAAQHAPRRAQRAPARHRQHHGQRDSRQHEPQRHQRDGVEALERERGEDVGRAPPERGRDEQDDVSERHVRSAGRRCRRGSRPSCSWRPARPGRRRRRRSPRGGRCAPSGPRRSGSGARRAPRRASRRSR